MYKGQKRATEDFADKLFIAPYICVSVCMYVHLSLINKKKKKKIQYSIETYQ